MSAFTYLYDSTEGVIGIVEDDIASTGHFDTEEQEQEQVDNTEVEYLSESATLVLTSGHFNEPSTDCSDHLLTDDRTSDTVRDEDEDESLSRTELVINEPRAEEQTSVAGVNHTDTSSQPGETAGGDELSENIVNIGNTVINANETLILPSFVVLNGLHCVLQLDAATGQLVAYPVEPEPAAEASAADVEEVVQKKRPRGRPRKQKLLPVEVAASQNVAVGSGNVSDIKQNVSDSIAGPSEQENNAAEGLLGLAADDNSTNNNSNKSSSGSGNSQGSEVSEGSKVSEGSTQTSVKTGTSLPTASSASNKVQNYLANLGFPVKRGRGRPRRTPLSAEELASLSVPTTTQGTSLPFLLPKSSTETGTVQTAIVIQQEDGTEKHIILSTTSRPTDDSSASGGKTHDDVEGSNVSSSSPGKTTASTSTSKTTSVASADGGGTLEIVLMPRKEPVKIGLRATERDLVKFKCKKCDVQTYYPQQLQQHLIEQHWSQLDDMLRCKCCSYLCFDQDDLTQHIKDSHPKCICPVCGFVSEHTYVIKRHMQRHDASSCECHICGRHYKDQYILKMHIKMRHTEPDVLFQCIICSKLFTRKAHLKRHLRIHNPDKPFKCPHCEYRGCERSDINKHILVHDMPHHTCEICGKSFRHIKNKDLHLKRHRGQRDFKCMYCEFYGYTYTDIRKHQERKHLGTTAVICSRCSTVFKTEQQLQAHQVECCERQSTSSSLPLLPSTIFMSDQCDPSDMQYVNDPVSTEAMQLVTDSNQLVVSSNAINIIGHLPDDALNLLEVPMADNESIETSGSADETELLNVVDDNDVNTHNNMPLTTTSTRTLLQFGLLSQ